MIRGRRALEVRVPTRHTRRSLSRWPASSGTPQTLRLSRTATTRRVTSRCSRGSCRSTTTP
eukprot:2934468-Heterocapsa_arctica.AAC.1